MKRILQWGAAATLVVACAATGNSQPDPAKWGDVSAEDFLLEPSIPDSEATAYVLVDYGQAEYDPLRNHIEFKVHYRMKILSEDGYDGASRNVYFGKGSKVKDVEGQTFSIDEEGRVQKTKMDKKSIFTEDIGKDSKVLRFTLPALAPGVIVEWRYTRQYDGAGAIPSWQFQSDEPVRWSEYRVTFPPEIQYVFAIQNVDKFDINEETEINHPNGDVKMYRWALSNLPAIRREEFMQSPSSYRAKLDAQFFGYLDPYVGFVTVLKSWDELSDVLREFKEFREVWKPSGDVKDLALHAAEGLATPDDQVKAIYDYVRTSMRWDETFEYFPDHSVRDVLERKSGSSSEINLLLVGMLRAAGFDANPVLISTRTHGRLVMNFPLLDQFNHVLAHVSVDDHDWLLDATDPFRSYNLLPTFALNLKGFLVREDGSKWIDLDRGGWYDESVHLAGRLLPDGDLEGSVEVKEREYAAVSRKKSLEESEPEDLITEEYFDDIEAELDSLSIEMPPSEDEATLSAKVAISSYAQLAGDFMSLNPHVVGRFTANPLQNPNRRYPLDLSSKRKSEYTVSIQLPDDYEVVDLPRTVNIRLPFEGGSFVRIGRVDDDGVLHLRTVLTLSKMAYPVSHYDELREMYGAMTASSNDMVVLHRKVPMAGN